MRYYARINVALPVLLIMYGYTAETAAGIA
jgi:hypothetical protein